MMVCTLPLKAIRRSPIILYGRSWRFLSNVRASREFNPILIEIRLHLCRRILGHYISHMMVSLSPWVSLKLSAISRNYPQSTISRSCLSRNQKTLETQSACQRCKHGWPEPTFAGYRCDIISGRRACLLDMPFDTQLVPRSWPLSPSCSFSGAYR